jgi:hypothetical protein
MNWGILVIGSSVGRDFSNSIVNMSRDNVVALFSPQLGVSRALIEILKVQR